MKITPKLKDKRGYFFKDKDDERCFDLNTIIDDMKFDNLTQLVIYKAKKTKHVMFFYCSEFGDIGEVGMCGKNCDAYKPKNKKSGCCVYKKSCYEVGPEYTITL